MPGMYAANDFDLAGFAVGAMERGQALPRNVQTGDVLIGLMSDGPHSNGYSLIRKIVEREGLNWSDPAPFGNDTVGGALLGPTRLYVKPALDLLKIEGLRALAHITGGGLTENLPRVLPDHVGARIDLDAWTVPPTLHWLITSAELNEDEALKTFNCGIGMIVVVAKEDADATLASLAASGETAMRIGEITGAPGLTYTGSLL
jgi:phosphoribosylformylglycinamidine cyclo-ligase